MNSNPEQKKLEVPGTEPADPEAPARHQAMPDVVFYVWAASFTLAGFVIIASIPVSSKSDVESDNPGAIPDLGPSRYERVVKRLQSTSNPTKAARELSNGVAAALVRRGPRNLTELICRTRAEKLDKGLLSEPIKRALGEVLEARSKRAPLNCLVLGYLGERLSSGLDLYSEVETIWNEFQSFELTDELIETFVRRLRKLGGIPTNSEFTGWLQRCGLEFDHAYGRECRAILRERAPEFGMDMLSMVEKLMREHTSRSESLESQILEALSAIANRGQPKAWQSKSDPTYNLAMRIAAVFVLCRFTQSPHKQTAKEAVVKLADAANLTGRIIDRDLFERWKKTCRIAFGQKTADGAYTSEALAPNASAGEGLAKYSFESLLLDGTCTQSFGEPIWYCAVRHWRGDKEEVAVGLQDFFTQAE